MSSKIINDLLTFNGIPKLCNNIQYLKENESLYNFQWHLEQLHIICEINSINIKDSFTKNPLTKKELGEKILQKIKNSTLKYSNSKWTINKLKNKGLYPFLQCELDDLGYNKIKNLKINKDDKFINFTLEFIHNKIIFNFNEPKKYIKYTCEKGTCPSWDDIKCNIMKLGIFDIKTPCKNHITDTEFKDTNTSKYKVFVKNYNRLKK